MLKITIHETDEELAINLAGRVAGPWAEELGRVWTNAAKSLKDRPVSLDLRDVTYIDEDGKHILRQIENETGAQLIATTPWTRHLVAQIRDTNTEE
jgi:anti-anti-sigma regulatory factor